jgi:hypothetical protein
MMFGVGEKVVCVEMDDLHELVVGRIYTVTKIGGVVLKGDPELICVSGVQFGKYARRFRPVVDISDLQTIVAEVKRGKPRKIGRDQFDKKPVHRSRAPQRAVAASPSLPQPQVPTASCSAAEPGASFTAPSPLSGANTARGSAWDSRAQFPASLLPDAHSAGGQ